MATFLGKAVIKAGIQASFVVFLFSRDYLEQAIRMVREYVPSYGTTLHDWLLAQRSVFQERRPDPFVLFIFIWSSLISYIDGQDD